MFDPYRKWLGIPANEQPPNYYRLLSINIFEDDLDVIEGAADRIMAFVRQYQSGEHAADAARILNELATARLCLLKPDKKAVYDASLRKSAESKPVSLNQTVTEQSLDETSLKSIGHTIKRKKTGKSKSQPFIPLLIGTVGFAVLIMIVVAFNIRGKPIETAPTSSVQSNSVAATTPESKVNNSSASHQPDGTSQKQPDQQIVSTIPSQPPTATPVEPPKTDPVEAASVANEKPMQPEAPSAADNSAAIPQLKLIRAWTGTLGKSQFGLFSHDGSRLVYAFGNDVLVIDTETGANAVRLTGHKSPVWLARFSSDGSRIISVGEDDRMRVWDAKTLKPFFAMKVKWNDWGSVLTASKNAGLIAFSTAKESKLIVMNGVTKQEQAQIEITEKDVWWRAVTPDVKWGMSNGYTNQLTFWNLETKTPFQIDNGHHNYCGAFSPDGTKAVIGGGNDWEIWDFQAKTLLNRGSVHTHIYTVGVSPNTERILPGLFDGSLWLIDVATGEKLASSKADDKPIDAVIISPNGKYAISKDFAGIIRLWGLPE